MAAILCSTCGTELDLPPGPPPRQVRCPVCRAVMDTALARRIDPDPLPAAEPVAPPGYPSRPPAAPNFPVALVLLVGGTLVTLATGFLFLLLIVVVQADQQPPRLAPQPPAEVRPVGRQDAPVFADPNPPRVVVIPGPAVPPPWNPPRPAPPVVAPRPAFQPPRPFAPPAPPAPAPFAPRR